MKMSCKTLGALVYACASVALSFPVHAEEPVAASTPVLASAPSTPAARDYDRFDLRFGGGWVFGADTTVSLIGPHGGGTVIDYGNTLDGDTSNAFYRFDGTWRMAPKHSLVYSFYDVNRTGTRAIDRDITFGDQTYAVGAQVDSQLDIRLHRVLYRYSLYRNEQIHFDVGGGLYYGKINMTMTANGFAGPNSGMITKNVSLGAPMPTAGINVECDITPRWGTFFSADLFYFKVNEWEGAQQDAMVGLTYKLARNWTLGAAYDRFNINLKGPVNHDSTFKVDNTWNSLLGFLSFHF
jgi:hypothetical protein